jgi:hypothetical protein
MSERKRKKFSLWMYFMYIYERERERERGRESLCVLYIKRETLRMRDREERMRDTKSAIILE